MLTIRFVPAAESGKAPEALALGVAPGGQQLASARIADADGLVTRALAGRHRFKGDEDDVLPVLTASGWLVLVGMGPPEERDAKRLRRIGGNLFAELADSGIVRLDLSLDVSSEDAAELAYGMCLRAWRPPARYRSKPDPDEAWSLVEVVVATPDPALAEARFSQLAAVAVASAWARDLVVAPGNELNPDGFCRQLDRLADLGVRVEQVDPRQAGLTLLQAVGQGSSIPPRLVMLRWQGGEREDGPLVFVGKGITFDSGGIDIKPWEDMEEMKGDMAGAAAVAGTIHALAARHAPVNAVGVLVIAENMPSGRATRPGDVVKSYAGLSVEIVDTDAEGRLALADALAFAAATCRPALMVDLATLTGAVEVSLGRHRAGLFTADDALAETLFLAGEAEDEPLWRLPLTDAYDEALKSSIADLRNCSWGHDPDALHAARFLQHFVPDGLPWAHLDIAGTSEAEEDGPLAAEGPTGFGIRLLVHLVEDRCQG